MFRRLGLPISYTRISAARITATRIVASRMSPDFAEVFLLAGVNNPLIRFRSFDSMIRTFWSFIAENNIIKVMLFSVDHPPQLYPPDDLEIDSRENRELL